MKTLRKLVPAIAMLMVSIIMLSTSSFAWFSMNTVVTATGMQVKAQAEGGIVISNSEKTTWSALANSNLTEVTALLPTSTSNLTTWYHGTSTDPSQSNHSTSTTSNGANLISLTADANGIGRDGQNNAYYLVTKYYIKSTTAEALQTSLYIKSVDVTTSTTQTASLNGALRVAVKYGDFFTIYGSTASSTKEYYVGAQSTTKTTINQFDAKNVQVSGVTSIANTDAAATEVQIYIWFEGEDVNCLSNNIAGLTPDELTVSVQFSTEAPTTP